MLRIVHERHERHEKKSAVGFSLTASYHACILTLFDTAQNRTSSLYTQRHSGKYAGTQALGGETPCTQVFTGCVVIPIVPDLALGNKQADRQTSQVFKTWEV